MPAHDSPIARMRSSCAEPTSGRTPVKPSKVRGNTGLRAKGLGPIYGFPGRSTYGMHNKDHTPSRSPNTPNTEKGKRPCLRSFSQEKRQSATAAYMTFIRLVLNILQGMTTITLNFDNCGHA